MFRFFVILFSCFSLALHADLVVRVKSAENLAPLFLAPLHPEESDFSPTYVQQLTQILQFDLKNNGQCFLAETTAEREMLSSEQNPYQQMKWRNLGIDYFVKPSLRQHSFSLFAFNVATGSVKKMQDLSLCGDLSKDRQIIHKAADLICATLFGEEGIASSRILYTLRTRPSESSLQWVTEVWEADYDGSNAHQLTHDGYLCVTPAYITDHQFLYVSYKIGQPKIYWGSTAGGEAKRLSYIRGNQLMPTLSSKQDKIAFICDVTGNPDLFVQDFSLESGMIGKAQQIFSAPQAAQGCPTFSPDGKKIAFVSNKDGTARVYVMTIPSIGTNLKDLHPHIISRKNHNNTSPCWSPDGKKIAYSATCQGVRQIWIYDFESGEESQLTEGNEHKENPTWASNSLHLLYNTVMQDRCELYLTNINQKEGVKISSGPGEKRFPAWQP
ncbi:MAG: Tol-Pal system protein TolB [Chlamydiales bacterium]